MMRALVAVALLALASGAHAQDVLSGRYLPKDAVEGGHAPPALLVSADGGGWTALFNGQPVQLEPVPMAGMAELFPDVRIDTHLQCAASDKLLLCRVDRGTRFEREGFTATTGYFSVIDDAGAFELVRLPDDEASTPGH